MGSQTSLTFLVAHSKVMISHLNKGKICHKERHRKQLTMCKSNGLPSEDEKEAANPSFMWHDESPMFPDPTTQFQITYDVSVPNTLVDLSSVHEETATENASHPLAGFLHCQEIEKPISAVCMCCWRAKVKCDRQSPCSKFHCSF